MSEWISVKKRLPRKRDEFDCSQIVLVRDMFNGLVSAWYQYGGEYQSKKQEVGYEIGWHASFSESTFAVLSNITHWRETPEPPKD